VLALACYYLRSILMTNLKELAFRYDLFVTPEWRDRFDTLINERIKIPIEVRVLDVNCGTGAHSIEIASQMQAKGEVVGIDPSAERIAIARAKALVKKVKDVKFEQGMASSLPFDNDEFEVVIGDVSMVRAYEIEDVLAEMVRVTRPEGRVILKLTTRGSFDEFFSVYWEALHNTGMAEEVWGSLEGLINERPTLADAEQMAERFGLHKVESFTSREEFSYETAGSFLEAPLITDSFLPDWLEIAPAESRAEVLGHLALIIDRERSNASFDVSVKAAIVAGVI
jgi:ubiquinone/menaquinone biosynthesis C-methylase UbiE